MVVLPPNKQNANSFLGTGEPNSLLEWRLGMEQMDWQRSLLLPAPMDWDISSPTRFIRGKCIRHVYIVIPC